MAWKKRTARTAPPVLEVPAAISEPEPHIDPLAEEPAASQHLGDAQLRVAVTRVVRLAAVPQDPWISWAPSA